MMNDKIQANLNAQVEAAQLNHCKVLLCEDDYCSAEIVTFFLKEIRITVEWAKDGLEGFAKFSKSSPGYCKCQYKFVQKVENNNVQI